MTKHPAEAFGQYRDELPISMDNAFSIGQDKYGDSWMVADSGYMLRRAEEEFYEFRQAVEHDQDVGGALKELADTANFALMFMALRQSEDDNVFGGSSLLDDEV